MPRWGSLRRWIVARWDTSTTASKTPNPYFDDFDRRVRLSLILAFIGGSTVHLLVALLMPERVLGGGDFARIMIALGYVSALIIACLPWRRYGRNLFAVILVYAAILIAGLIYSTGGANSPFGLVFLLITISAGLYYTTRLAMLVAGVCVVLGFLPYLYSTPAHSFFLQQLALGACILASAGFQRLILPELLRRARAEQGLQDDLRETRRLRDELARANARLIQQARTDPLTDLLNRGAIIAAVDEAFGRAGQEVPVFSILFFDVDRFKQINDTYGHQMGDTVLVQIARLASLSSRLHDAVGRYGGEEYLIVLPAIGKEEASRRAERLRTDVAEHRFVLPSGVEIEVTISIGIATTPEDGENSEALLRTADDALYLAKAAGRNRAHTMSAPLPSDLLPDLESAEHGERIQNTSVYIRDSEALSPTTKGPFSEG